MDYNEKDVVTKFTKGNAVSDCGEYNLNDLLDMFDETELTNVPEKTVNECIDNDFNNYKVNTSLIVTDNEDGMFCYAVEELELEVECSASLDLAMYNESI